eukprot:ANDGO_04167.mRNA.1 Heat shock 70 kDa protein 14
MSVFGIDFGNESLVMASAGRGGVNIVTNEASNRLTPSMVGFGEGARAIGEAALTQSVSNFRGTARDIKRFIGKDHAEQEDLAHLPSRSIVAASVEDGDVASDKGGVRFRAVVHGDSYLFRPEQVLAMLLKKLHGFVPPQQATNDAVIAVPAYFDQGQRIAVMNAAKIAGLNCLAVMNDLTAAALDYALFRGAELPAEDSDKPENIVIVDVGHSALKVACVSLRRGLVNVKAHGYDINFGSRVLDVALANHYAADWEKKTGVPLRAEYPKSMMRLVQACEKVKKTLSANAQAQLNIECLAEDRDMNYLVSREFLEQLVEPLLARALEPVRSALELAGWAPKDVTAVEMIGGGSRIPAVKKLLADYFGQECKTRLNASEAICRGAAIECAILSPHFKVRETQVKDAHTASELSMAWTPKGRAEPKVSTVFEKNAPYPAVKMVSLDRSAIDGNSLEITLGPRVGVAAVSGIPPAQDGKTMTVKLRLGLNVSGLYSVEGAEVVTEWDEEKVEEKSKEEAKEGDVAAAPAAAEEKKPAIVRKKQRADLKVEMRYAPELNVMSSKLIDDAVLLEGQLLAQDKLIMDTWDRKNALESYIYALRSKIYDDNVLAPFVTEDVTNQFSKALEDAESWLYSEEGENAAKQAYVDRLNALKKIGDPIELRHSEFFERPSMLDFLSKTIASVREKAAAFQGVGADEDRTKVVAMCDEAGAWLAKANAALSQTARHVTPSILCREIADRANKLISDAKPLLNKKRDAPKVEADVKMEDSQPQENLPKDADAEEIVINQADSNAHAETMDLD